MAAAYFAAYLPSWMTWAFEFGVLGLDDWRTCPWPVNETLVNDTDDCFQ